MQEHLVEIRLGRLFKIGNRFYIKPYVGVGSNYYKHEQQPKSNPLKWRFGKVFIPIGFLLVKRLCQQGCLGIRFEWRPDIYSKVKMGSNEKIDLTLQKENGFRIETPLTLLFGSCNRYNMQFIPFTDWNTWGKVKDRTSLGVPLPISSQKRWNLGIRFMLGTHF